MHYEPIVFCKLDESQNLKIVESLNVMNHIFKEVVEVGEAGEYQIFQKCLEDIGRILNQGSQGRG